MYFQYVLQSALQKYIFVLATPFHEKMDKNSYFYKLKALNRDADWSITEFPLTCANRYELK